jgi:hypothetical protein
VPVRPESPQRHDASDAPPPLDGHTGISLSLTRHRVRASIRAPHPPAHLFVTSYTGGSRLRRDDAPRDG